MIECERMTSLSLSVQDRGAFVQVLLDLAHQDLLFVVQLLEMGVDLFDLADGVGAAKADQSGVDGAVVVLVPKLFQALRRGDHALDGRHRAALPVASMRGRVTGRGVARGEQCVAERAPIRGSTVSVHVQVSVG